VRFHGAGVLAPGIEYTLESWPLPCWPAFLEAGDGNFEISLRDIPHHLTCMKKMVPIISEMYNEFSMAQEILRKY
jgi:hypothetical protein